MINFEILDLSNYDPNQDIIIAYVDVGKMPPRRAQEYLDGIKEKLQPKFEKRKFDVIYVACRGGVVSTAIKVTSKENSSELFDDALKVIK